MINKNFICARDETGRHARFRLCYYSAFNFCGCRQVEIRQKNQIKIYAPVVKLADTLDLGSNSERSAGSSPVGRTNDKSPDFSGLFIIYFRRSLRFFFRINCIIIFKIPVKFKSHIKTFILVLMHKNLLYKHS